LSGNFPSIAKYIKARYFGTVTDCRECVVGRVSVKTVDKWRKHLSSHAAEIVQVLVLVGGGSTTETQAQLKAARDDFAKQMRADGLANREIDFVVSEFDVAVEKQLAQLNSSTRRRATLAGGEE
jgi:hypothetical protein